eukprot:CAMPEP_0197830684 /NCGR_PEP_ID=MMETSP1437-20131217/7306_1 /TAXON_ID=49252 ORGANISM="Eucampia antarctica, Strain CCMP1452" /NCGR_SAMPLE_ID=MMETSP1437 /ASSEMBLY_ACC=CAM_ASM_001096 /LENGTH=177 /DNA_ID=CAMNT_0043433237 /DNA_START=42 /DNA_END=575 /DNA_ORIENTATION=-
MYGFGAYNPRGQTATDDYNEKHHELLRNDIMDVCRTSNSATTTTSPSPSTLGFQEDSVIWWDAASIWEDGSSEKGFIVALNNAMLSPDDLSKGEQWIVDIAAKYGQGAIYKFLFFQEPELAIHAKSHPTMFVEKDGFSLDDGTENEVFEKCAPGKLFRETVPVLDPGTNARVEVIID